MQRPGVERPTIGDVAHRSNDLRGQRNIVPDQSVRVNEGQSLDGGDVLPGFALPLAELFARLDKPGKKKGGGRKNGKKGNGR